MVLIVNSALMAEVTLVNTDFIVFDLTLDLVDHWFADSRFGFQFLPITSSF